MGFLLALVALILEIVYWAQSHDLSLPFVALVLVTLAILVGGWGSVRAYLPVRR
jgi:hypothetical protein